MARQDPSTATATPPATLATSCGAELARVCWWSRCVTRYTTRHGSRQTR
ncbi:hypothetical protein [Oceanisphaera marina]|nr:hypothetical protein [Oceanisphaera marina]